ncbi:MAG: hypothetical protein E7032_07900 [Akkermansiaceae bacterium]|nr:hypothetical protein [Akkermansiaceae bacterium]
MTTHTELWQAVHTAYEAHNPDEARRLLNSSGEVPDCSLILRCGDEDYIRWLLSNELIAAPTTTEQWPELQELQLQCPALQEADRPACILDGNIKNGA